MRRLIDTKPTNSRMVNIKPTRLSMSGALQLSVEIISKGQYMGIPGLTYPVEMTIIQAEIP